MTNDSNHSREYSVTASIDKKKLANNRDTIVPIAIDIMRIFHLNTDECLF
ncbi:MAG: hypothetical protein HXY43_21985 [Fischerella sp.]|nr:hypothetical protein [Fischerella sp.]NWF61850.1 hypothetical protein [Fischerella sp.]